MIKWWLWKNDRRHWLKKFDKSCLFTILSQERSLRNGPYILYSLWKFSKRYCGHHLKILKAFFIFAFLEIFLMNLLLFSSWSLLSFCISPQTFCQISLSVTFVSTNSSNLLSLPFCATRLYFRIDYISPCICKVSTNKKRKIVIDNYILSFLDVILWNGFIIISLLIVLFSETSLLKKR